MRVRAGIGALWALAAAGCLATAAEAQTLGTCRAEQRECRTLTVPLDRSGVVPGSVRLRIERVRAARPTRPPLLVMSGMPGQSIIASFDDRGRYSIGALRRSRDLLVMDLRGTGKSGALRCPALDRAVARLAEAAGRCAASLGPRRGFYTARDSAQDIEAVRQALGIDRFALLGGSYGAQVAFAYAQLYPDRVDRLVLDSSFGPEGFDPLYRAGLAAVPQALQVLCRKNRCHHASSDPLKDVTKLADRLDRGPVTGLQTDSSGRRRVTRLRAFDLFTALFAALDGARAVMGYVHNAARGDLTPLLRISGPLGVPAPRLGLLSASPAAYAASMCEEARLPWSRSAPLGDRGAQVSALVASLPKESLLPLGPRVALESDVLELCRLWPVASPAPERPKALPAIPTLVVASVEDMLAPVSMARAVANLIPGARLLRLRGAGHDVFGAHGGGSSCASQVLLRFLAGERPDDVCGPEHKSYRGASKPPPLTLREVPPDPRLRSLAGRVLTAVNMTLRDGGEILQGRLMWRFLDVRFSPRSQWRRILLSPARTGALRRGTYAMSLRGRRLVLRGASYVPGIRVTGSILFAQEPSKRRGVLRVHGSGRVRGLLVVRHGMMTGRLGASSVRAPTRWGPDLGFIVR